MNPYIQITSFSRYVHSLGIGHTSLMENNYKATPPYSQKVIMTVIKHFYVFTWNHEYYYIEYIICTMQNLEKREYLPHIWKSVTACSCSYSSIPELN